MSLVVKEQSTSSFEPIEEGLHTAVCVTVAGIGKQETPWGVKEKVILTWELPELRREWTTKEGEQKEGSAQISNTYTCSLSPRAKLREVLESWRGQPFTQDELGGFDLSNLLGKACQILIKHTHKNGNTYANVADIMKMPAGKETPPVEAALLEFSPYDWNDEAFDNLPDWIKNKVTPVTSDPISTPPAPKQADVEELEEDEIPF